ncbi:MAG: carboxypeptidase-like regulatory domain-containing protein [Candidatus Limnocylindria bacterium]
MPSTRTPRVVVSLGMLSLVATFAACDVSSTPSVSAEPPVSGAPCGPEEIAASGIAGSVVDTDGTPLEDILVQVDTGEFNGTARTGADGAFSAPGVTGDFVLTTVDIAYDSVTQRVTVPCGETVDVELVLTPTGD